MNTKWNVALAIAALLSFSASFASESADEVKKTDDADVLVIEIAPRDSLEMAIDTIKEDAQLDLDIKLIGKTSVVVAAES